MHKQESVAEKHRTLSDFGMLMDQLITPCRPVQVQMIESKKKKKKRKKKKRKKKKKEKNYVLVDHKVKTKESEKLDKYIDLTRELKSCET